MANRLIYGRVVSITRVIVELTVTIIQAMDISFVDNLWRIVLL